MICHQHPKEPNPPPLENFSETQSLDLTVDYSLDLLGLVDQLDQIGLPFGLI
jgi:hypothetical protein